MTFSIQRIQDVIHPHASRLVQAGWLLFALFALSLGAAGISGYQDILATPCYGPDCLPGQFTYAEWKSLPQDFWNSPDERVRMDTGMVILISLLLVGSAALIIWQHSNKIAFVLGGFVFLALAVEPFVSAFSRAAVQWSWALRFLQIVHLAGLAPFLGMIPDGGIRPRWLRIPILLCALLGILIPLTGASQITLRLTYSALIVLILVVSFINRFVDSRDVDQREQLVWLMVSLMFLGGTQVFNPDRVLLPLPGNFAGIPMGTTGLYDFFAYSFLGTTLLWAGAIVCLLIGIMRGELFQLEIILNRTMLYAILTLFVLGIYIIVVGYLSLIFQSSGSLIFSLIATGLAAVLFQPVRSWAQRFVNQMLYGERDRPYAVLEQLNRQLESVIAPQDLLQMIVARVRSALKLPYAAVSLRNDDQGDYGIVAAEGEPEGEPLILPLVVQGGQIGQFILSPRSTREPFTDTDRRMLSNLAGQVGMAAHTALLMMELQRARERLVYSREEERLRLRRDLHDGLGTTLAALNLQAGNIRKLIPADPAEAEAAVLELRTQLHRMIAEVRRLINDLRPKTLDEFGFGGAIEILAADITSQSGVQVTVRIPDSQVVLPPAVEVAAFRIIQESVTNVIKHSAARTCLIQLGFNGNFDIEILDDGVGLPDDISQGKGLRTIRERVLELGGSCSASRREGGGTRIFVQLPLHTKER